MRFGSGESAAEGSPVASIKDRILAGALDLFNEEGAASVSAVDIASALGISPGHLYYHFKGKAEIVAALFDVYESELALVLEAACGEMEGANASVETMAVHVHILMEEAHDVRFLFREAGALAALFPGLAVRYARVFAAFEAGAAHMLACLAANGVIDANMIDGLSRTIALGLGFKLTQLDLEGADEAAKARIARAAAEVMTPVAALARA